MFKVLGKLRCGICSEIVEINDKVFLDHMNTIIHQKCHCKHLDPQIPIKDEGTFRKMLLKYPIFK
ncbi:hypothetical protein C0971_09920 [Bacillus methanolicus]|nr:hypothetical protein C0971_09920 [Bacillus methanolicus]